METSLEPKILNQRFSKMLKKGGCGSWVEILIISKIDFEERIAEKASSPHKLAVNWFTSPLYLLGHLILKILSEHQTGVGIKSRKGGKEKSGYGHENKFKRCKQGPPERNLFGSFGFIDIIDDNHYYQKQEGNGEYPRRKLRNGIAQGCSGKGRV